MDTVPSLPSVVKTPRKINLFIPVVIILVVILGLVLVLFKIKMPFVSQSTNKSLSPYILDITQPVNTLEGQIDQINGDTLSLKVNNSKAVYQIKATDKTNIYLGLTSVSGGRPTIKDLKVGESVAVSSSNDLRTFSGTSFEALSINVLDQTSSLNRTPQSSGSANPASVIASPPMEFTATANRPLYTSVPTPKNASGSASGH